MPFIDTSCESLLRLRQGNLARKRHEKDKISNTAEQFKVKDPTAHLILENLDEIYKLHGSDDGNEEQDDDDE